MLPKAKKITKEEVQALTRFEVDKFLVSKGFVHEQMLKHASESLVRRALIKDLGIKAAEGNLRAFRLINKIASKSKDCLEQGIAVRLLENLAKQGSKNAINALCDIALNNENRTFRTTTLKVLKRLAGLGYQEVVIVLEQVKTKETDYYNLRLARGGLRAYKKAVKISRKRGLN